MFCASLFSFIGQLYVIPQVLQDEYRSTCLKFALGPRHWLHGVGGHAFFRAHKEIGFPIAIRCVESANLQLILSATSKHVPHFTRKLNVLEQCLGSGNIPIESGARIIATSPYACCRIVHDRGRSLDILGKLPKTPQGNDINRIIYDAFFDNIYVKHAALTRLADVYRARWCGPHILNNPQPAKLANVAAKHLRWMSKRLPPRVQIACVRFQLNGWHTGRRYQNRATTHCQFCSNLDAQDSIEHFVHCPKVHDLFPQALRTDARSKIPIKHFFLFGLDGKHRLTYALLLYALYAVHNDIRHSTDNTDFKLCVRQHILESGVHASIRQVATDILQIST